MSDRRAFLAHCTALGVGGTLLPGILWSQVAQGTPITVETVAAAEQLAGVQFTADQRMMMLAALQRMAQSIAALHRIPLDNAVAPALVFDPVPPGATLPTQHAGHTVTSRVPMMAMPSNLEELAYQPITQLSQLVRTRKVTSTQLTRMYLARLERLDATLHAVISLTTERALTHARAADEEIARGRYRGPLHGLPWGAKDLLAVKGYRTTWGAGPYREQVIGADATVVRRLDEAGAVLIAKLTLGELAQGDVWFGGVTRNPWWPEQGSSGSSAGPAATVAAGCVAFAIGTETQGSISSPSTRTGATGLRPSFGRVPRTGAMALAWSMDKIGPICRSAEDCAIVLSAIAGPDGEDRSVKDLSFTWDAARPLRDLRVGYVKTAFDAPERNDEGRLVRPAKAADDAMLATLQRLGVRLTPVTLPDTPTQAMSMILTAEAGAAFEELVRSGHVSEMVQQHEFAWPNTFRAAQFIPAVDYINANRARTKSMQDWWTLFETIDALVVPTGGTNQISATNLMGYPAVILPHGFVEAAPLSRGTAADSTARSPEGVKRPDVPVSFTILGGLYREADALRLAHAFQSATDFNRRRPPI